MVVPMGTHEHNLALQQGANPLWHPFFGQKVPISAVSTTKHTIMPPPKRAAKGCAITADKATAHFSTLPNQIVCEAMLPLGL